MNYVIVKRIMEKLDSFTITDYHGLDSPGLTCYLNSVLQVLFMTEDFREAVEGCCSTDSTTIDPQLGRLFADLQRSVARTHEVIKRLGITDVYEQRDAAEYLEKILCLTSPAAAKIFKGELNYKATCLRCGEGNHSRSFFWILPLSVEDLQPQTYSVEKGLKAFFKGEKVCGDNKMFCSRCDKKQDANFGCEMTHNPEILTLLLKRFSFDYMLRCYIKLHCSVDVPQTLHMENCKYDLYAVVHHFGNLTGGHYTAQIKSFETYMWYDFNDKMVTMVKPPLFATGNSSLRSCTAYLLMYRKVNKHPEKTDEGNQEAFWSPSDVDAEGRHDEAERGEAVLPHRQLTERSCYRGGSLNGDILTKSHDDNTVRKQTNISWEVENPVKQRAACVCKHKDILLQTDTGTDLRHLPKQKSNFKSLTRNGVNPAETKLEKNEREEMAEERTEGGSSSDSSSSTHPHLTGHMQSQFTIHEPNVYRKSNRLKRDKEETQHGTTAYSIGKLGTKQTVKRGEITASPIRERRKDKARREPWRC